jgi:uncharacterized lipoprotein YajG
MKNEWLFASEEKDLSDKDFNVKVKLQDIMNQIDEGKGWRFTEEQAETLAKLVDKLVEQVKADTKKRNTESKSFITLPFLKIKVPTNH